MKNLHQPGHELLLASAIIAALVMPSLLSVDSLRAADLTPLPLVLPEASNKGTPDNLPEGPHVEKLTETPRPAFMAPKGVKNVALGKKVTSSVDKFYAGTLSQITDGKKDAEDDQAVEMKKGPQWVQIDLEKSYPVAAIVLWHDYRFLQVFHGVVVQAADDPAFTKNVRTIFNNDFDNKLNLGAGSDLEYFEKNQGKLIDTKGIKARYFRFYSQGSSMTANNVYQEIEIYAPPAP